VVELETRNRSSHFTHRVAVIGYVYDGQRFLLLKRLTPPYLWAPPGGHLFQDEDPRTGLLREIKEETGLEVKILVPVDIWFQKWKDHYLLSIDFLVEPIAGHVQLSHEHSEYKWVSLEELERGEPIQLSSHPAAFRIDDFRRAHLLYHCLKTQQA